MPTELAREHRAHAEPLAERDVGGIVIATLDTVREAVAALRAVRQTGVPVWLSFVCGPSARFLSGEPRADALESIAEREPAAIEVDCLPPFAVEPGLPVLAASGLPLSVCAHLGAPTPRCGFRTSEDATPSTLAKLVLRWKRAGATVVGSRGCGTRPAHVSAMRSVLGEPGSSRPAQPPTR